MKTTLRSIVVVAGSVAMSGAVVLSACGFPSPVLLDLSDAGAIGLSDAMTDAVYADVEVGKPIEPGSEIAVDAGQKVDAAGCTDSDCDCDRDGFEDYSKFGCAPADPDAGLGDCDDTDTRLRPNQQAYFQDKDPPNGGDWNCNLKKELFYRYHDIDCSKIAVGDCAKAEGFQHNPGCGEEDLYVFCRVVGIILLQSCEVDPGRTETRIQACK